MLGTALKSQINQVSVLIEKLFYPDFTNWLSNISIKHPVVGLGELTIDFFQMEVKNYWSYKSSFRK